MPTVTIRIPPQFMQSVNQLMADIQKFQVSAIQTQQTVQQFHINQTQRIGTQIGSHLSRMNQLFKKIGSSIVQSIDRMLQSMGALGRLFVSSFTVGAEVLEFLAGPIGWAVGTTVAVGSFTIPIAMSFTRWIYDKIIRLGDNLLQDWLVARGTFSTVSGVRAFRASFAGLPIDDDLFTRVAVGRADTGSDEFRALLFFKIKEQQDSTDMLTDLMLATSAFMKNQSGGIDIPVAQAFRLTSIFPPKLLLALIGIDKKELEEKIQHEQELKKLLRISPEAVKGWSKFSVSLNLMWVQIETIIAKKLADPNSNFVKSLTKLIEAMTKLVEVFLNLPISQKAIDLITNIVQRTATYLEKGSSPTIRKNLKDVAVLMADSGKEVDKLRGAVERLSDTPTALPDKARAIPSYDARGEPVGTKGPSVGASRDSYVNRGGGGYGVSGGPTFRPGVGPGPRVRETPGAGNEVPTRPGPFVSNVPRIPGVPGTRGNIPPGGIRRYTGPTHPRIHGPPEPIPKAPAVSQPTAPPRIPGVGLPGTPSGPTARPPSPSFLGGAPGMPGLPGGPSGPAVQRGPAAGAAPAGWSNDLDRQAYDNMFSGTKLAGHYDDVVRAAQNNNVPPSLVAGIMAHESARGRSRMINEKNNPAGIMIPNGPGRTFSSIEEGINSSAHSIAKNYNSGGRTIPGMAGSYAPPGAANDPGNLNRGWPAGVTMYQHQLQSSTGQPAQSAPPPPAANAPPLPSGTALRDPVTATGLGGGVVGSGYQTRAQGGHQGLDILAPAGSPIYASGGGVIEHNNARGTQWNDAITVIRMEDGRRIVYMHHHLDPGLKEGSKVEAGQQIGTSGVANNVAHLHYEIWSGARLHSKNITMQNPWTKKNLPVGGRDPTQPQLLQQPTQAQQPTQPQTSAAGVQGLPGGPSGPADPRINPPVQTAGIPGAAGTPGGPAAVKPSQVKPSAVPVAAVPGAVRVAAAPGVTSPTYTGDTKEVADARTYLVSTFRGGSTSAAQGGASEAVTRLHPEFALRLAKGVKALRDAGYTDAGINSAFRTGGGPTGTGSRFDLEGKSLHSIGAGVDLGGIGGPGSKEAARAHKILSDSAGVFGPYGPNNKAEWNHFQLVPQLRVGDLPTGNQAKVQELAGRHLPTEQQLHEQLWPMTGVPFPADKPTAQQPPSGRKTMLFLHGMESRYNQGGVSKTPGEVEDSMRRYANSKGYDFEAINVSGDYTQQQLKEAEARIKKGGGDVGAVTGFSAGGSVAATLKRLHPELDTTIIGNKKYQTTDFPGEKHMNLPEALAKQSEKEAQEKAEKAKKDLDIKAQTDTQSKGNANTSTPRQTDVQKKTEIETEKDTGWGPGSGSDKKPIWLPHELSDQNKLDPGLTKLDPSLPRTAMADTGTMTDAPLIGVQSKEQYGPDISLKSSSQEKIHPNALGFVRAIGRTETDFSRKEAYSDATNRMSYGNRVSEYDYGYYQMADRDVNYAVNKLGMSPDLAQHLNGGPDHQSTVEQQTAAVNDYLKRRWPDAYQNLVDRGDYKGMVDATRSGKSWVWFGLRDKPEAASTEYNKTRETAQAAEDVAKVGGYGGGYTGPDVNVTKPEPFPDNRNNKDAPKPGETKPEVAAKNRDEEKKKKGTKTAKSKEEKDKEEKPKESKTGKSDLPNKRDTPDRKADRVNGGEKEHSVENNDQPVKVKNHSDQDVEVKEHASADVSH